MMAMPRKYSTKDAPVVGAAIEMLQAHADAFHAIGQTGNAMESRAMADNLYAYLARNMTRKSVRTEAERKSRNMAILVRGYQKRIAELEEKLLLVRVSTDLCERGVLTSGAPDAGGKTVRMKRRIDHLEAKLLIIRELTDTTVGKRKNSAVPEKERQVHDARIRVDVEKGLRGRTHTINPAKVMLLEQEVER